MRRMIHLAVLMSFAGSIVWAEEMPAVREGGFEDAFSVNEDEFSSSGRNAYFVLEPGYTLSFTGQDEDEGEAATLVISVLNETRRVAGVETRVVEERESVGGQLKEVSRNYVAISRRTSDVFYFGEKVDMYEDGRIVGHGGSWLAGQDGNRYGLLMPGTIRVGRRYFQEVAPNVAMDRAEIVGASGTMTTEAGTFESVLRIEETTPLEPGVKEYKYYAPGVGLIQDGNLKLVSVLSKGAD